ncbi:hypothetical protein PSPO01_15570 [Paraphaeosphaeria sporulosa]
MSTSTPSGWRTAGAQCTRCLAEVGKYRGLAGALPAVAETRPTAVQSGSAILAPVIYLHPVRNKFDTRSDPQPLELVPRARLNGFDHERHHAQHTMANAKVPLSKVLFQMAAKWHASRSKARTPNAITTQAKGICKKNLPGNDALTEASSAELKAQLGVDGQLLDEEQASKKRVRLDASLSSSADGAASLFMGTAHAARAGGAGGQAGRYWPSLKLPVFPVQLKTWTSASAWANLRSIPPEWAHSARRPGKPRFTSSGSVLEVFAGKLGSLR